MNEELDSQLSAMFDNELPAAECELLARRLSRDGDLKARWGRYAVIGTVIRAERGVTLDGSVAGRVSAAIWSEPHARHGARGPGPGAGPLQPLGDDARRPGVSRGRGGSGHPVDAVAAARGRGAGQPGAARQRAAGADPGAEPAAWSRQFRGHCAGGLAAGRPRTAPLHEPDSYVVPAAAAQGPALVPPTELANYIVAHSAYSGPLMRRNALSALMAEDSAQVPVSAQPIAATVVTGK